MRLGEYEIASEIGRGGAGAVFRARSPEGREVAIKLLLHVTPETRARFERERRLLASLGEAEGFVSLLDGGDSSQGPWIAMPLLGGGTLRDRLARGPLPVAESVALVTRLSEAAGRAHERGIVHRDLKPENVLFTGDGRALVADLGLAKHARRSVSGGSVSVSLSVSGQLHGTAGYMAPEQATDAKAATPASDVFALGAILHECLAGAPAFQAEGLVELIQRVDECRVTPVRKLRPEAPAWLEDVLRRALAREPEERFQDGFALARALRTPVEPGGRRVALLAAAAGLAALASIAGAAAWHEGVPSSSPPRVAPVASSAPVVSRTLAGEPSSDSASWVTQGRLEYRRGDRAAALAAFTHAIELDGRNAEAWLRRGVTRGLEGDRKGAVEDLDRAIDVDGTYVEALAARGAARVRLGALDLGAADLDRAIALDPRCRAAFAGRAALRRSTGDLPGAETDASRAIELDPGNADAWSIRAGVRLSAGNLDDAESDLEQAFRLGGASAADYVKVATLCHKRGDRDGERRMLDRGIAAEPRNAFAHESRAMARARDGELDGAIEDFGRAIELDPSKPRPLWNRARARESSGDAAGAIADYERALTLDPPETEAEKIRARLAKLRGR